jgi:hypothetical protein
MGVGGIFLKIISQKQKIALQRLANYVQKLVYPLQLDHLENGDG